LVICLKIKSNKLEVKGKKQQLELRAALHCINDDCCQKHQNGNFVDAMHHPEVKIGRFVGIRFLKNPNKIMTYFPKLKKFF
jgi:hypothetical protein